MNKEERLRKTILDQLIAGFITRKNARKRLRISNRHFKRILSSYRQFGDEGLIHKSRGRPSAVAYPMEMKERALTLYRKKYPDFGPTFASEKLLEEDGLAINAETLRLWLKAAGLWEAARKRKEHRTRRARRPCFGELLQLDGSIHAWFDGIAQKQCLMNMVDDATGKTLALMDYGETTQAAFALLKWWITEAGIPMAIYVDLKSLYVSPKSLRNNDNEELIEPEWLTHFSKACKKLGIEIIKAYSPQAKGRVERNHAVYQDRFMKELKLKGITTIEGANELLSNSFINKLNDKFAKPPANSADAHVKLSGNDDLEHILCWEFTRQVKNDWTVQLDGKYYQIEKSGQIHVRAKQNIMIKKHLDGSLSLWHKGCRLPFHAIKERPAREPLRKSGLGRDLKECSETSSKNRHKTPWGKFNQSWLSRKPANAVSSTRC